VTPLILIGFMRTYLTITALLLSSIRELRAATLHLARSHLRRVGSADLLHVACVAQDAGEWARLGDRPGVPDETFLAQDAFG